MIEATVVDCSFKKFTEFPETLPNSTVELFMQGSLIDVLGPVINSTAYTREGTPFITPLTNLQVLRIDKNPITNISINLLRHENLQQLKWLYVPRGTRVLEQLPLKLIDHGVPEGWREVPAHPFENRNYIVWTRGDISPIIDSSDPGATRRRGGQVGGYSAEMGGGDDDGGAGSDDGSSGMSGGGY